MATNLEELTENIAMTSESKNSKTRKKKSNTQKASKKSTSSKAKKATNSKKVDKSKEKDSKKQLKNKISNSAIKKPEIEKEKPKKRTIKNVKTSNKKEETKEKTIEKQEPKKKRTLHLNLHFGNKEKVVDTSVNQNSSFFTEPSVFEKFNLSVSGLDDEEIITFNKEDYEESDYKDIIEPNYEDIDESDYEDIKEPNSEDIDESDYEDIDELNYENIEESDYKISEAANDIMPNTIGVVTTEFQENSIKKFIENRVEDLLSDTEIETPNSFTDNENEIQSLLENTEVEEETAVAEPINTFFDSSIPSISTSNVDTVFAKTKKSLSSIFKKFSFEETALNNNINPKFEEIDSNEIINNITSINTNTSEKPIDLVVPEIKVDAEPIDVTVPVIETDISTLNDSTNVENEFNEVSNVLSQDSSIENISFDEEEIEKLIESDNTVELNEDSNKQEIDYENSNSLDVLPELDEDDDSLEDVEEFSYDEDFNYDDVKEQDVKESYDDDSFSIESYFGLDKLTDEDFADETDTEITEETVEEENENVEELENIDNEEIDNSFTEEANNSSADEKNNVSEFSTITKLLESFNESINNLSDKISVLETENKSLLSNTKEIATVQPQENDIVETNTEQIQEEDNNIEENTTSIPEQQSLSDFEISDEELMEFLANEENTDNLDTSEETLTETETVNKDNESDVEAQIVEDILSEAILSDDTSVDDEELKNSLLSEVLSAEEDVNSNNTDEKIDSDFSKVLECLTKAINDLEDHKAENNQIANKEEKKDVAPIIPEEIYTEEISPESGKAINILIDKDDIFSIQILNETYEIVADFDGISVLSENIHISTPKNNFYVKIGEKYIEIHNNKDHFSVYTNFEDVEFANAINNVGFAKKNNRIELNIKEAFKLASVNNRIELSMLNKTIASIKDTPVTQIDENSICDNKTLLISEETQKVYLPYTISEVMNKLKYNDEYKSIQDVVDKEYTVPLSTFKMPIISRFREAYMFMRTKENSSIYAAIDLAVELMFNSNLNPAVIRAAKDLKELNIYLDCLYENEVDKFDCFKIIYKVLPKIK